MSKHHYEIGGLVFAVSPENDKKPKSVQETLSCPTKEKWKNAMKEEMKPMKSMRRPPIIVNIFLTGGREFETLISTSDDSACLGVIS